MHTKQCPACSREMGLTESECYGCRTDRSAAKKRPEPEPNPTRPKVTLETTGPKLILPCAVCETRYKATDVSQRTCGPACQSVYEARESSRQRNLAPGHPDFVASTPKEARKHDRVVRRRVS